MNRPLCLFSQQVAISVCIKIYNIPSVNNRNREGSRLLIKDSVANIGKTAGLLYLCSYSAGVEKVNSSISRFRNVKCLFVLPSLPLIPPSVASQSMWSRSPPQTCPQGCRSVEPLNRTLYHHVPTPQDNMGRWQHGKVATWEATLNQNATVIFKRFEHGSI